MSFGLSCGLLEDKDGRLTLSDRMLEGMASLSREQAPALRHWELQEVWEEMLLESAFFALTEADIREADFLSFLGGIGVPVADRLLEVAESADVVVHRGQDHADVDRKLVFQLGDHLAKANNFANAGEARFHIFEWLRLRVREGFKGNDVPDGGCADLIALFLMIMLNGNLLRDLIAIVAGKQDEPPSGSAINGDDPDPIPN